MTSWFQGLQQTIMVAKIFGKGAYSPHEREEAERQTGWGQEHDTPRLPSVFYCFPHPKVPRASQNSTTN